jgi:hypothetical protein
MLTTYVFIILYAEKADSVVFALAYISVITIDNSNFILTQTMIFRKMKPDSRGVIIAIEAVLVATFIVVGAQVIQGIQNSHASGQFDGSYECYVVFFIILVVYWFIVIIYTVINYNSEKK